MMTNQMSALEAFKRFPEKMTIGLFDHAGRVALYVDTRSGPPRMIMGTATDCRSGDGYRWYQVFSIAFAAHLGWSPILRDALGLKRRGQRELEKGEDGVRAQMIEEYVIALLFIDIDWLNSSRPIPSGVLEEIRATVAGLEVAYATEAQWASAIEAGRRVWKIFHEQGSGFVTMDGRGGGLSFSAKQLMVVENSAPRAISGPLGFERIDLIESLELALLEVKPGVAELFRPLRDGGWVNTGSKAEEWSLDPSDGFRWHDAFHLSNLAILSWSPVAASLLGFSDPDLRPQLLEEAIIARAYRALLSGSSEQVDAVAKNAHRICSALGGISLGEVSWKHALMTGWTLTRRLNGSRGAVLNLDAIGRSISIHHWM